MKLSPTQLTIDELTSIGMTCVRAEYYDPRARRSHDLLGFIDVLAFGQFHGIIGVQCTDGSNFSKRVSKIRTECAPKATAWLRAGGLIQVYGWRTLKGSDVPVPRVTELTLADFEV